MRRAVLILAVSAVAAAFTGPCFPIGRGAITSRQQGGISLRMTDSLEKTDVEAIDPVQANDSAGAIATTMKPIEAESQTKVKKEWIKRSKAAGKFPANLFIQKADEPGAFIGGGWAKSNPQVVSEMKGPATWIAISLCLTLQFSIMGTYSMDDGFSWEKSFPITKGTPLSISKGSTGGTINCREVYGLPCFPSGNSEAFTGF